MSEMLTLKYNLPNREHKRKSEKEFNYIMEKLYNIELSFYKDLFIHDIYNSYEQIYTSYLDKYLLEIKIINFNLKPKYFDINEYYFSDNFKPLEFPKNN